MALAVAIILMHRLSNYIEKEDTNKEEGTE